VDTVGRGIIVDLDGTLIDSSKAHVSVWKKALKSFGVKRSDEEVRRQLGKTSAGIAEALMPGASREDAEACALLKDKLFQWEGILQSQLVPGANKALKKVKAMGYDCAVASSNPRPVVEQTLLFFNLMPYVDAVVSMDDVEHGKPHPEMMLKAAATMGLNPQRCIAVGDSVYDILAGKGAGMPTIAVLTGVQSLEELMEARPTKVIKDISKLPQLLSTWSIG